MKCRTSETKQLAEHIEFKPAQTLEEAKEFARTNLKIKDFELTNLDLANHINEALVNINKIFGGRKIFNKINLLPETHTGLMCAHKGVLKVNETRLLRQVAPDNLVKYYNEVAVDKIGDLFSCIELSPAAQKILNKAQNGVKKLTFNEKVLLKNTLDSLNSVTVLPQNQIFEEALRNNNVIKWLKGNNYPTKIEDFIQLSENSRNDLITSILNNTNYKIKVYDRGEFGTVYHEIGHALHHEKIGTKKFNAGSAQITGDATTDFNAMREFRKYFYKREPNSIKLSLLSAYAPYSEDEAVAEIFSFLCNGNKFNDEIMKLYKKFGGPELPNM